nr:helix-turn-helix transcriptional regulator [Anaerolineae bacterium]
IFVDVRADLLFNFGAPYLRRRPDGQAERLPSSNLDAPRDQPVTVEQVGQIYLVGVRFRPAGLAAILPMPVDSLLNHTLPPPDVLGTDARTLEARLYEADGLSAQKPLLDAYFLRRLAPSEAVRQVGGWLRLLEQPNAPSIGQLARLTGYSARTLDRRFRSVVGVPPKQYARIARFQRALGLLARPVPLTELALAAGFYDQSHLTREFRALAGQSPERARADLIGRMHDPAPNLVRFVQDADPSEA